MHETTGQLTVRVAGRSDRLAICTLLQQAWHSAGGARWDQLDAIEAGCAALLATRDLQTVGFCLLDLRTAPVARLSAVAVSDHEQVAEVWGEAWQGTEGYLREQGIQVAYYAGDAPWLLHLLASRGFEQVNTLVSYEKVPDGPHASGNPGVHLRPARSADLPVIEQIDVASFPLLWRYPRSMLEVLMQASGRFTVAELERRLVGYQLCTQEGSTGQIVRLAVLPEYRRRAIGSRLVADGLVSFRRSRMRRVTLNTQRDNLPAQRLYERFGFQCTGEEIPVLAKTLSR